MPSTGARRVSYQERIIRKTTKPNIYAGTLELEAFQGYIANEINDIFEDNVSDEYCIRLVADRLARNENLDNEGIKKEARKIFNNFINKRIEILIRNPEDALAIKSLIQTAAEEMMHKQEIYSFEVLAKAVEHRSNIANAQKYKVISEEPRF